MSWSAQSREPDPISNSTPSPSSQKGLDAFQWIDKSAKVHWLKGYRVHCTWYLVHCTLYRMHCDQNRVHCDQYRLHCTGYTVSCTGCQVHMQLKPQHKVDIKQGFQIGDHSVCIVAPLRIRTYANHQLWQNRVHKKFKQDELQFELKVKKENKLKFPSELSWSPRPACLYLRMCSYDRTVCKVCAILPFCL